MDAYNRCRVIRIAVKVIMKFTLVYELHNRSRAMPVHDVVALVRSQLRIY